MWAYRHFLCRAVGGEELCVKVLSFPLHTRAPLTWGLHLGPKTHHGHIMYIIIINDLSWLPWLPIIPQVDWECENWKTERTFSFSPLLSIHKKIKLLISVSHLSAYFLHMCMLSGKYLLFYLLQRRLFNGTLHRLLLDRLYHLLLQRDILEKTNPLVSHTDTTASTAKVNLTKFKTCDISEVSFSPVVWGVHTWPPAGPGLTWKVWVYKERTPRSNVGCLEFWTWERTRETTVCKVSFTTNLHRCIIKRIRDRATHISFSFWGLTVWPIRGLLSTGEPIRKLSLSECSELIDWLRNCDTKGRKPINQSSLTGFFFKQ